MSGQARRSKVIAAQRRRRGLARRLVPFADFGVGPIADPGGALETGRANAIEHGHHFDVHAAREIGRLMVAMPRWRRGELLHNDQRTARTDGQRRRGWRETYGEPS